MEPIKVLVVDDHDVVRKGIITYLMTEDDIDVLVKHLVDLMELS